MGWPKVSLITKEVGLALLFGVLSVIFAFMIQVNLPGISEANSDFREIPLIIGVFYYRKRLSIAISCVITSLTFYNYGPEVYLSVFVNHFIALLAIWYCYQYLKRLSLSYIFIGLAWMFFVVVYYLAFLFPLLSLYEIIYLGDETPFFQHLWALISVGKVEVIVTTLITSSFLMAIEMRRKLEETNNNLETIVRQRTTELVEANNQLIDLNEDLASSNEKILLLNENLESLVKDRTIKINEQLSQLTKYANMNAHEVRGPLARLLGLKNLIKIEPDESKKSDLIKRLSNSADELDEVVKKMNRLLEEEIISKPNIYPQEPEVLDD